MKHVLKKLKRAKWWQKTALIPLLISLLLTTHGSAVEKRAVTKERMERIARAVENYIYEHDHVPPVLCIKALARLLETAGLGGIPCFDAWGAPFHITLRNRMDAGGMETPEYWIGSGGETGDFGGFLEYMTKGFPEGTDDIVYHDGTFVSPA